jgi:uncharacterized protein YukE
MAYCRANSPEEKAPLELLKRSRESIVAAQQAFREKCEYIIDNVENRIIIEGNEFADHIEEIASEEELRQVAEGSGCRINALWDSFNQRAEMAYDEEVKKLELALEDIAHSDLAQMLVRTLDENLAQTTACDAPLATFDSRRPVVKRSLYVAGVLQFLGVSASKSVTKLATGPAAKEGAELTLKAISKSTLHKTVYNVGKFFGKSFKPWEAVKMAEKITKWTKVLGIFAVIVDVLLTVKSKFDEEKRLRELNKTKVEIREQYRKIAIEVRNKAFELVQEVIRNSFDKLDESVAEKMREIRQMQETTSQLEMCLEDLYSKVKNLIEEIQGIQNLNVDLS